MQQVYKFEEFNLLSLPYEGVDTPVLFLIHELFININHVDTYKQFNFVVLLLFCTSRPRLHLPCNGYFTP